MRRDDRALLFLEDAHHLLQYRLFCVNHVIGEQHGEWFVAYQFARRQHCMSQSQRFFLTHVRDVNHVRNLPHHFEKVFLSLLLQNAFQFVAVVEMVFNRSLAAAGDHDYLVAAGGQRLFDAILNDGFIHQREHFLGLSLGSGKKSRAQSRCWKHRLADFHHSCFGKTELLSMQISVRASGYRLPTLLFAQFLTELHPVA